MLVIVLFAAAMIAFLAISYASMTQKLRDRIERLEGENANLHEELSNECSNYEHYIKEQRGELERCRLLIEKLEAEVRKHEEAWEGFNPNT
jgi:chromosome segregation ATPase